MLIVYKHYIWSTDDHRNSNMSWVNFCLFIGRSCLLLCHMRNSLCFTILLFCDMMMLLCLSFGEPWWPAMLHRLGIWIMALQWRHNGCDIISNHQPRECLLSCLIRRRSKKTSKLRVTGLCAGNSPETGDFPAQRASKKENVFIWWRRHGDRFPTYPLWPDLRSGAMVGIYVVIDCGHHSRRRGRRGKMEGGKLVKGRAELIWNCTVHF